MPRRPIIGVIGGNNVPAETIETARALGALLARQGVIVLTGGQPTEGNDVKRAAMRGAIEGNAVAGGARLIGVLPLDNPPPPPGTETQKVIRTALSNGGRNPLNAFIPDSIIALEGGAGTLAELGFSLFAGKPVYFANSFARLADTFAARPRKLDGFLKEGVETLERFDLGTASVEDIKNLLAKHFANEDRGTEAVIGDPGLEEIVRTIVMGLGGENVFIPTGFPQSIPILERDSSQGSLSKADFEGWLVEMP